MNSRSFIGLVMAALLALPAAAQAQARRSTSGSGVWLGGAIGFEAGDESGYQLRFDGEFPITRLNPDLQLSGVGSVSFAGLSSDVNVMEFVPAARFTWLASQQVGAYGDVGLGLFDEWHNGHSSVGATMRFGAGGYLEVNPSTRLFGEVALHPHFGDYDDTTLTLLVGVKFRI
jgi:hypothetical protein